MGKRQKQRTAVWMVFLQGVLLALGIYLLGQLPAAALMVRGSLPESAGFPAAAVLCVLSVTCGGLVTVRRVSWGALPAGLLTAGLFIGVLVLVGLSAWTRITWLGRGGILMLCALGGGLLSGVLGSRRGRRSRRKRK